MTTAKEKTEDHTVLDRVKEELGRILSAQVEKLAAKAGDKLTDVAGRLTESAENGGALPRIGSRVLKGDNPVKAAFGEKTKDVKDKVLGKSPGEEPSDGSEAGGDGPGDVKVTSIVETLDVGVPLRTAYDHWTEYEKFTSFTKGVRDVSMEDEVISDWKVKVAFSTRSWKATVLEQLPDDRIVWKSEGPQGTTHGVVSFHEIAPTLTRILLVVEYYPSGFLEKTGNIWRAQGRRMRLDFKNFQRYITFTTEEAEGWRGEIRDGEVVRTHDEAVEAENGEGEGEPEDDAADGEEGEDRDEDAEGED